MLRVIIAGLIAGWLTGKLMHGRGYGVLADILLGLVGAVIGQWIFGELGVYARGGVGFIAMAVVGCNDHGGSPGIKYRRQLQQQRHLYSGHWNGDLHWHRACRISQYAIR